MRKVVLISIIISALLSACGSSKGHCDAYGNKSGNVELEKQQTV